MSYITKKSVFGVSEQARHKPGCTDTKICQKFEILDIVNGFYYLGSDKQRR